MSQASTSRSVVEWTLRGPQGREYPLPLHEGETLSIGRDLTCEVAIVDAGISRHHADLSLESGELWIEDLHSQNGCFVNSTRVQRHMLHEGDILTLGRVHLTVHRCERSVETLRKELDELPKESLARLLSISFGLGGSRPELTGALDHLAEALELDTCLLLEWAPTTQRTEYLAGRDPSSQVELLTTTLRGDTAKAVFEREMVLLEQDPQTGRRVRPPLVVVPVGRHQHMLGFLAASRAQRLESTERAELSVFASLLAARWRSEAGPVDPSRTVLLDSARHQSAGTLGPAPARVSGRSLANGAPLRLLTLLESQVARARRRIGEAYDIDAGDHDDLVETSLIVRAVSVLLDDDAPRAEAAAGGSPLNLSTLASHTLRASALRTQPLGFAGDSSIGVDAPKDAVSLVIELIASATRRLFDDPESTTVRTTRGPLETSAELWFECRDGSPPDARLASPDPVGKLAAAIDGWNEQDISLVLARRIVTEILGGALLIEPERSRVGIRLPVRSLAPKS